MVICFNRHVLDTALWTNTTKLPTISVHLNHVSTSHLHNNCTTFLLSWFINIFAFWFVNSKFKISNLTIAQQQPLRNPTTNRTDKYHGEAMYWFGIDFWRAWLCYKFVFLYFLIKLFKFWMLGWVDAYHFGFRCV